jgi:histidine triad (HIT) family protein
MKEDTRVLYRDEIATVMIPKEVSALGELIVLPNNHEILFENLPDETASHMAIIANKASMAQVAALGCAGTNLLIQSGEQAGQKHSHTFIRIIPRFEKDNINLEWQPQKLSEEDMSTIEIKLREACQKIFFKQKEKGPEEFKSAGEEKPGEKDQDKYKHMLEHLKRMP